MIDSKQLLQRTGISRATLNNYVALGVLPSPRIAPPGSGERGTRLGYFPADAVSRILAVRRLKEEGLSMSEIARQISAANTSANTNDDSDQLSATSDNEAFVGSPGSAVDRPHSPAPVGLSASVNGIVDLDSLPGPAYMVNNNFDLIWWNDSAAEHIFLHDDLYESGDSRSLLRLLVERGGAKDRPSEDMLENILRPHLAVGRKRLGRNSLLKLYTALDNQYLGLLERINNSTPDIDNDSFINFESLYFDRSGAAVPARLYVLMFREGFLFTYSPPEQSEALLRLLNQREYVIRELMKRRKPHLSSVAVLVADLQNSVRVCAELPPEEYFELINSMWQETEPLFRKYFATYGKHAGDGMVYYFFPQPDCNYVANAIECAVELRELMRSFTRRWQDRKGWFNDLHLNIGLNEGQEWFGSFSAGPHVEFTVLGETVNYAARISDFARDGAIWASKSMLGKLPRRIRKRINYGVYQPTGSHEQLFVSEMYSCIQHMGHGREAGSHKLHEIETLPITEIRGMMAD